MEYDPAAETLDTILGGAITIVQPRHGYRFGLDAILLADFVRSRPRDRVLELGAGCGVIATLLAAARPTCSMTALELQPILAACARRTAMINQLENLCVVEADLRSRVISGLSAGTFDCVVANPPYRGSTRGRESLNPSRRQARSAATASLEDFVAAAARYCKSTGRFFCVFTAGRSAELIETLERHRLEPKRLRYVHPYRDARANLLLIEARKNGGRETIIEPPLIVWSLPGEYEAELSAILAGRWMVQSGHRGARSAGRSNSG